MKVGYLISSHVLQHHIATPPLLDSLLIAGVEPEQIVVHVNGSAQPHEQTCRGVRYVFQQPEFNSSFEAVLLWDWGFTHWFAINGTSRAGMEFRKRVEKGFDAAADVTLAGSLLILGHRGSEGRAMNDLGMYRDDYLRGQADLIHEMSATNGSQYAIEEMEGVLYAVAQRRAKYPVRDVKVDMDARDIYQTGTPRITEYYPGIDWYRFKKNWGQLRGGEYKASVL